MAGLSHPLAPHSGRKKSVLQGGIFCQFFYNFGAPSPCRREKNRRQVREEQKSLEDDPNMPSEACKKFCQKFVVDFYRSNTLMALESKYVRYKEHSVEKFKEDMARDMLQALRDGIWYREMEKRDFTKWFEMRVNDCLWNIQRILTKYGKDHGLLEDNTYIEEVMKKADNFVGLMKP